RSSTRTPSPSATASRCSSRKARCSVPSTPRPSASKASGLTVLFAPMAERAPNEFEQSFQQLESIVRRLESEELPLDESLQLFEEGIRLSRFCHQRLAEVEKKIELILADAKGEPRVEPFEADD